MTDNNVKPLMGEEELNAAIALINRVRLMWDDQAPSEDYVLSTIEAATLIHDWYVHHVAKA